MQDMKLAQKRQTFEAVEYTEYRCSIEHISVALLINPVASKQQ